MPEKDVDRPRESAEGWRTPHFAGLLAAVFVIVVVLVVLLVVPPLNPIVGFPLALADLLAVVAGLVFVSVYRLIDRLRSPRKSP